MPELPEVETIRIGLQKKIVGQTISSVVVLNPKSFQSDPSLVISQKVVDVIRRAKVLGIQLDNGYTMLFHLKMSGQVILEQKLNDKKQKEEKFIGGHPTKDMLGELPNTSTRVIFTFSDGGRLFFNDQRKFGWIRLIQSSELRVKNYGMKTAIGPEPLEKDFNWEILKNNLLKRRNLSIKVALLDQTVVAGVGNIYASEACFNAEITPDKKVKELSDEEFRRLCKGVIKALSDGIKYGGSTRTHFVNADGEKGLFLVHAAVYNREGKKCLVCQNKILKIKLGGRSTFYCNICQK